MEAEYRATVALCDGQEKHETGSFQQCAEWCEGVIRSSGGNVMVTITRIRDGRYDQE